MFLATGIGEIYLRQTPSQIPLVSLGFQVARSGKGRGYKRGGAPP